jgi:hypothetical protein
MPLDAKELAKEKELNRELSDEEMDRLLIPKRSIGTWLTVALLFVGMIGGAGYLFGARILKAGRNYAAEVAAVGTTEQRRQATEILQNINSKAALWKLQHGGRKPTFDGHPDWEQFLQATDVTGKLSPGRGMPVCGPYLATKPINPINNLSSVLAVEGEPELNELLAGSAKTGFVYSKSSGRFWVTDVAGTRVIDPEAIPTHASASAPAQAPAATPDAPASTPSTGSATTPAPAKEKATATPPRESKSAPAKAPAQAPAAPTKPAKSAQPAGKK